MQYTPDVSLFLGCALLLAAVCRLIYLRLAGATTDKQQQQPSYTFDASDVGRWRDHLDSEGFVVLRGVLSRPIERLITLDRLLFMTTT